MGKKEDFHEGVQELFQPTFDNRPMQYIGRDGEIEQFMAGLKEPVGSRKRLIEAGVIESPVVESWCLQYPICRSICRTWIERNRHREIILTLTSPSESVPSTPYTASAPLLGTFYSDPKSIGIFRALSLVAH